MRMKSLTHQARGSERREAFRAEERFLFDNTKAALPFREVNHLLAFLAGEGAYAVNHYATRLNDLATCLYELLLIVSQIPHALLRREIVNLGPQAQRTARGIDENAVGLYVGQVVMEIP
jgi:hypothetical protein